jgi:hypothetical protein
MDMWHRHGDAGFKHKGKVNLEGFFK